MNLPALTDGEVHPLPYCSRLDSGVITCITDLDLADSALHAPGASWENEDFYPDFRDKAAVLVVRLAKNPPLPDGNKRAAWVSLRVFIEMNDWEWRDYPSPEEAEQVMVAIASSEWDEQRVASWLIPRLMPASTSLEH